ncbi:MAG: dihydroorotase [Treponema sp.]|nr:dihydroorotase [Treponema sp.]
MKTILHNFRIVDETTDMRGTVVLEDGLITEVLPWDEDFPGNVLNDRRIDYGRREAGLFINGRGFPGSANTDSFPLLVPAFVDLHAHFRESGGPAESPPAGGGIFSESGHPSEAVPPSETGPLSETLESGCLAAVAGGYGTVVCMANTRPPVDTVEKAARLRERADRLGLIDLYPVLSLTKNMEGKELSGIAGLEDRPGAAVYFPPMLSEDGRDLADDGLLLAAMEEARRLGLPVSCHCDFGGPEEAAARAAGRPRRVWSRIGENNAVRRIIALGKEAGCHIHIAHVSTKEAADLIREAKAAAVPPFTLTCEATPHHIALTEADAAAMGPESHGRVNPPLREDADRRAIIEAIRDGTIDAIATDHAPHRAADKAAGAPGFTGLETAFGVCCRELVRPGILSLSRLSALMSANPARIVHGGTSALRGAPDRGRIAPGFRADLAVIDGEAEWTMESAAFRSRGRNSPFIGQTIQGRILITIHQGRIVFDVQHG